MGFVKIPSTSQLNRVTIVLIASLYFRFYNSISFYLTNSRYFLDIMLKDDRCATNDVLYFSSAFILQQSVPEW